VRNALERRQWAKRLNEQWEHIREKAVQGFVELGEEIIAAWLALRDLEGEPFATWADRELKFGRQHAYKFMKIARWAKHMGCRARRYRCCHRIILRSRIAQFDEETFSTLVECGVHIERRGRTSARQFVGKKFLPTSVVFCN
jgi:hypothetical protein